MPKSYVSKLLLPYFREYYQLLPLGLSQNRMTNVQPYPLILLHPILNWFVKTQEKHYIYMKPKSRRIWQVHEINQFMKVVFS